MGIEDYFVTLQRMSPLALEKENKMKISIVIPVYRVESTLPQCIDSIVAQSFGDWEAILVDDGSDDHSPEICDRYAASDPRISVIHKANGGLSSARNAGIQAARGEWITFIDSDDYIEPGTLASLAEVAASNPKAQLIEYPAVCLEGGSNEHRLELDDATFTDPAQYWIETQAYMHTYAWNKMMRRQLMAEIRFPVGKKFEDTLTLPHILKQRPTIVTTSRGLYHYTYNPRGITAVAGKEEFQTLLDANIDAAKILGISIFEPQADAWYLHMLNQQIHLCRLTHDTPQLPSRHLPIGTAHTWVERIKIIILNTLGLNALCRIMRIVK